MKKPKNYLDQYQSPETPRAKGSEFKTLKESLEKAKKYDKIIEQINADNESIKSDIAAYKELKKMVKIGYVAGYVDGKISAYNKMVNEHFSRYLKG